MDTTSIIITSLITLAVTVVAGLAVEYLKRIKPKLELSVKESIPIELEENKKIGANVIYVCNPSSRPVKDINIRIKAAGLAIRNGGIKSTTGLDYDLKEEGESILVGIPFLKHKDYISITSIIEGRYGIPKAPEVTIRSPDNYKLINKSEPTFRPLFQLISTPAIISALVVGVTLGFVDNPLSPSPRTDQGAILALSAAFVGLPDVASNYTSNTGVYYYNQGPYIYSLAKATTSNEERRKLRLFLIKSMQLAEKMAPKSRSAICFFVGKISLLLGEKQEAETWFNKSKDANESEHQYLMSSFVDDQPLTAQSTGTR